MPQVTTGATLLRADIRFPEVHELPRGEGVSSRFVTSHGLSP